MTEKKVAILGAGFSGLTLAWVLTQKNIPAVVFESSQRQGGMLGSKFDGILVEQAANALLASDNVEKLLADIGVIPVQAGFRSKKRWIFRRGPKRLPLSFFELATGLTGFLKAKLAQQLQPQPQESLAGWGQRILNRNFCDYLISPAFQGVYGTTAERLSASLILKPFFTAALKSKKGTLKGSISAKGGMQEIINALSRHLAEKGVTVHTNSQATVHDLQQKYAAVVIATSLESAKSELQQAAPATAAVLKTVPLLPLATVTLKFAQTNRIQGFGCLFPAPENFHSLGVLFNSDIFPERGDYSETWISTDVKSDDAELLKKISQDRMRLIGRDEAYQSSFVHRWEKALPLYGPELEKVLSEKDFAEGLVNGVRVSENEHPLYLTGNYLGVIGLAKILDYNIRLSQRIEKELR